MTGMGCDDHRRRYDIALLVGSVITVVRLQWPMRLILTVSHCLLYFSKLFLLFFIILHGF
jgi:hypothetical protein